MRNQARLVHVVATLAREDGGVHNAYRDAFHLQTECHRIATNSATCPQPHAQHPAPRSPRPAPYITINTEPSGSVSAKGASDDLSATLLKHAGFQQIEDWYGRRHRLPTTTPQADRAAIASHAAEMLRAARYSVDLDPDLDTSRLTTPANPLGLYIADDRATADRPDQGRRERCRPCAGGRSPPSSRARRPGTRPGSAGDGRRADHRPRRRGVRARRPVRLRCGVRQRSAVRTHRSGHELRRVGDLAAGPRRGATQSPALPDSRSAALATSPAADKAKASSALGTPSPGVGTAVRPSQVPSPRTR